MWSGSVLKPVPLLCNDILTINVEIERPASLPQQDLEAAIIAWLNDGKLQTALFLINELPGTLRLWAKPGLVKICSVDLVAIQEAGRRET